jgi:hypothetical protein
MQKQKTRLTSLLLSIFITLGVFAVITAMKPAAVPAESAPHTINITDTNGYVIADKTITLEKDETFQLAAVDSLGHTGLVWSDDSPYITVDATGKVTVVDNPSGTIYAIITVSCQDNYTVSDTLIISIKRIIPDSGSSLPDSGSWIPEESSFISEVAVGDGVYAVYSDYAVLVEILDTSRTSFAIPGTIRVDGETVPVTDIDVNAFKGTDVKNFTVVSDKGGLRAFNGVLYSFIKVDKDGNVGVGDDYKYFQDTLVAYPPAGSATYTLPLTVRNINSDAFSVAPKLVVTVPRNHSNFLPNTNGDLVEYRIVNGDAIIENGVVKTPKKTEIIGVAYAHNDNLKFVAGASSGTSTSGGSSSFSISATVEFKGYPTSAKIFIERTITEKKSDGSTSEIAPDYGAISYILLKGDYTDTDFSDATFEDMKNHPDFIEYKYSNWRKSVTFNITNLNTNTTYTVVPFTVANDVWETFYDFGICENIVFTTPDISLETTIKTVTADTAKFKIKRTGSANGALGYVLLKGDVSDLNYKTLEEYQNLPNFVANQTSNWTGGVTVTVKGIESGETYTVVPYTQRKGFYSFGLGENITFTAE